MQCDSSKMREVKLRYGYVIKCDEAWGHSRWFPVRVYSPFLSVSRIEVVRGPDGEIQELRCSYDPDSLGKRPGDLERRCSCTSVPTLSDPENVLGIDWKQKLVQNVKSCNCNNRLMRFILVSFFAISFPLSPSSPGFAPSCSLPLSLSVSLALSSITRAPKA